MSTCLCCEGCLLINKLSFSLNKDEVFTFPPTNYGILVCLKVTGCLTSDLTGAGSLKNTLILRNGGDKLNILLSSPLEVIFLTFPSFSRTVNWTSKSWKLSPYNYLRPSDRSSIESCYNREYDDRFLIGITAFVVNWSNSPLFWSLMPPTSILKTKVFF